jgi:ribosome-interacting GTPase 1
MLVSFKYAILRSDRSKVNDMRVGLEYSVADGDIITIVSRN